MSTYNGFSTIDANKPKTTTSLPGVDGGVGGIVQPIILGKEFIGVYYTKEYISIKFIKLLILDA
jgi:hypothetical protein